MPHTQLQLYRQYHVNECVGGWVVYVFLWVTVHFWEPLNRTGCQTSFSSSSFRVFTSGEKTTRLLQKVCKLTRAITKILNTDLSTKKISWRSLEPPAEEQRCLYLLGSQNWTLQRLGGHGGVKINEKSWALLLPGTYLHSQDPPHPLWNLLGLLGLWSIAVKTVNYKRRRRGGGEVLLFCIRGS